MPAERPRAGARLPSRPRFALLTLLSLCLLLPAGCPGPAPLAPLPRLSLEFAGGGGDYLLVGGLEPARLAAGQFVISWLGPAPGGGEEVAEAAAVPAAAVRPAAGANGVLLDAAAARAAEGLDPAAPPGAVFVLFYEDGALAGRTGIGRGPEPN